jgi:hypothetical protein
MKLVNRKQFVIVVLVTLLVAGVTVVSASSPGGFQANLRMPDVLEKLPARAPAGTDSRQELTSQEPVWQPVNSSGFGVQANVEVSALSVFNGYLYAGASNPTDGARIFRSPDGATWTAVTEPGFGISHDTRPPSILDLAVFNGRLYASTGRGDDAGQIWRSLDGINWAPMVIHGFSDPDTVDITCFAEYGGMLYAGATNRLSGVLIFRSFTGDSNSWTLHAPLAPGTIPASVTGLAVFDGGLYAAVDSLGPAQIWSTYGGAWAPVVSDGFGNSLTTSTGGLAEFASYLYAGAGNETDGAQLWRTQDGASWEQMIPPGFGDPNNQAVEVVFAFQNQLYAGVKNTQSGLEVWRSPDGTIWEQVNPDGFGDPDNTGSNGSNAVAEYLGNLYLGTANLVDGGEIWRMQGTAQPTPDPTPTIPQPQTNIFMPMTLRFP